MPQIIGGLIILLGLALIAIEKKPRVAVELSS